jgi:fermentation-respiration switch protein FrsA (DUF1100 family)
MRSSWAVRISRAEDFPFTTLKVLLLAGLAGYLGVALLVWFAQERLLFYPQPASGLPAAPPGWRIEEVSLPTRDGTVIAGVLLLPPVARPPLVIYHGGNAEEVTSFAAEAPLTYGERAVLLVNYRGYGRSQGRPGEKRLVEDAVELFDWAARRADVDASRIALHGRSLGSGVAVQLAAARPARCIVLTSPFSSARDVAREIYPWLPVGLLLRHPFDSAHHAPRLKVPALILTGDADTLIPRHHSERLAGLWGGPVERAAFAGFGHNDIHANPKYAGTIRAFLDRCL